MNKFNKALGQLIDYIRKDSGVHNVADATEQLSLLLLLKYFHSHYAYFHDLDNNINDFPGVFFPKNEANLKEMNPSMLRDVFREIHLSKGFVDSRLDKDKSRKKIANKIDRLLNSIPLKIQSAKILQRCIYLLSEIDIDNSQFANAYDELLLKMTQQSVASGAYHSPKGLVEAIVDVIAPSPKQRLYDPALGTGRVIIEVQKKWETNRVSDEDIIGWATGNDISPFALLLGTLNLLLNQVNIESISLADSLQSDDDTLFDVIISGVPIGKPNKIYEERYSHCPTSLEAMFLEHTMSKLALGGKAALIVPDGLLFNSVNSAVSLRKRLLVDFNLHSILSLPKGSLAPYTNIKLSVLFFENSRPSQDVWFYELKSRSTSNRRNSITKNDLADFIKQYRTRSESGSAKLIKREEILLRKGFNLSSESHIRERASEIHDVHTDIDEAKRANETLSRLVEKYINSTREKSDVKITSTLTLEELIAVKSGKPLSKSEISGEGEYPVYGANGPIGYFHTANRSGEHLLIGRVGAYCGNVHYVKGNFWLTHNSFSVETLDESIVCLPYLAHVLRSMNLNRLARGAAQPFLSFEKIKDLLVPLPSYETQVELSKRFDLIREQSELIEGLLESQINTIKSISEKVIAGESSGDF